MSRLVEAKTTSTFPDSGASEISPAPKNPRLLFASQTRPRKAQAAIVQTPKT